MFQVVIGGRNRYLFNGSNVQKQQIDNLFHSVMLNVNNPHFLIMQGRITKVLNMKPIEILGLIEEAAGTRMFEMKKQQALKTIEKSHIKGEAQLTNLYREKELLGALRHPAIVRLHATLKDEARLYFLLEQLEGGELLWHMRRAPQGRLPEETARRCLGALLLPLRYMQEQGVLYRDLKPTNALFSRAGRLKLVDFGHAKRLPEWRTERSHSVCGTPHYHAPETVRGEGHGPPAQLWALGVLLYNLICGKMPYQGSHE